MTKRFLSRDMAAPLRPERRWEAEFRLKRALELEFAGTSIHRRYKQVPKVSCSFSASASHFLIHAVSSQQSAVIDSLTIFPPIVAHGQLKLRSC